MIPGVTAGTHLANVAAGSTDPFYANVVALLHFNGIDGGTTFTDEKGKTWTSTDGCVLDDSQFKFGATSLADPTQNARLGTVSHADFGYGTGDFTIEFWMRPSTLGSTRVVYDQRTALNQTRPTLYFSASNFIYFVSGANRITSGVLSSNTWYFIALSRVSGSTRLFINGVQVGTTYTDATNYDASRVLLGDAGNSEAAGQGFVGWLDELRITKGVGRYSSNFTPPVAAFPDS
jgi:hypothetical protein